MVDIVDIGKTQRLNRGGQTANSEASLAIVVHSALVSLSCHVIAGAADVMASDAQKSVP